MSKKKIAILTHYCNSINYGGNLQAYALTYFLNNNGYSAYQVSYPLNKNTNVETFKHKIKRKFKESPLKFFCSIFNTILIRLEDNAHRKSLKQMNELYNKRFDSFKHFNKDLIPHTIVEYTDDKLYELNNYFDIFISGSDQVFNLNMMKPGFFLNFVNKDKIKLSYAASMAMDSIPFESVNFLKESLSSFDAISVREEKTQDLLAFLKNKKIELVVDPTLLLSRNDWDRVASDRIVSEDYVFCYFLGENLEERMICKKFTKNNNLKLVCIPMFKTRYKQCDLNFGDVNLPYASPEDFISLIKYASYIFTDSFHACVFSILYDKKFLVFDRDSHSSMNSRIISLMKLFHVEQRYLKNSDINNAHLIMSLDTNYIMDDYLTLKNKSIDFLLNCLGDSYEK